MIPHRSITQIAAVGFPEEILKNPGFGQLSWSYIKRIFAKVGYPFDLRVVIKNFPRSRLISTIGIFEDFDLNQPIPTEYSNKIDLMIDKDTKFDGFLVWLKLYTTPSDFVDVIDDHTSNWLPVYFPVFYPGIEVSMGDKIEAVCQGMLSDDQINPDYKITGRLIRQNGEVTEFEWKSFHHKRAFRTTPFYQNLFAEDGVRIIDNTPVQKLIERVKVYLRKNLPHPILEQVRKLRGLLK